MSRIGQAAERIRRRAILSYSGTNGHSFGVFNRDRRDGVVRMPSVPLNRELASARHAAFAAEREADGVCRRNATGADIQNLPRFFFNSANAARNVERPRG